MLDNSHSVMAEGTDVGIIGGLAVAVWFLILDTVAGHPFQTPSLLGQVVLFGDSGHILLPFGTYAKNVLKAKTAAVIYPQATGITESALTIAAGLKKAGIATKAVGYTQGQTDLTAPLTAAGATTADFVAPYGAASDCANQAKALKQLGITEKDLK